MSIKRKNKIGFAFAVVIILAVLTFFTVIISTYIATINGLIPNSNAIGIGNTKSSINTRVGALRSTEYSDVESANSSQSQLSTFVPTDITNLLQNLIAKREQAIKDAAEKHRIEREAHTARALLARKALEQAYGMPEGLSEIEWDVEEVDFVREWGDKINAYLAGSPLQNQGSVFAKAAWDECIDPRWSPAISNTESSKGARCFLPYNAWGWGQKSWSNWEEAIKEHVKGLSAKYGYTIAKPLAKKYCPPNSESWYNNTLNQMKMIG
ncbi:MAG: CMP-2-keto-3-deoxyoctulosonic acid synthetase [Coriobacteriia bacterium]|nr:CMP-2-keto-3-deoxyoctulosonic acid synthetase [Coriobacteriia bacterium]